MYSLYQAVWLFLVYAFLGWCSEVCFAAVNTGKFVNRGFLNGPVCPIYGFGALSVVLCLTPIKDNALLLFLGSVVLTSALEYITGFVLEKLFHDKWWDYSDQPFNIHGYICLKFSIMWGLACIIIMRVIHPTIELMISLLNNLAGRIILSVIMAVFAADLVLTIIEVRKLPRRLKAMQELDDALNRLSQEIGENLTEKAIEVKTQNDEIQEELSDVKEKLEVRKDDTVQKLEERRAGAELAVQERRTEIKDKSDALREDFKERSKTLRTELDEMSRQRQENAAERRREREELLDKYQELLASRSPIQERLLNAFPSLGEGRYKTPIAKIRERAGQRRNRTGSGDGEN